MEDVCSLVGPVSIIIIIIITNINPKIVVWLTALVQICAALNTLSLKLDAGPISLVIHTTSINTQSGIGVVAKWSKMPVAIP